MSVKLVGLALLLATVLLAGCGKEGVDSGGRRAALQAEQHSRTLFPVQPALKEIYNRSCRNCHTIAATGAPLTGDALNWAPRMNKGMDTLLNNVIDGFGGMPPFGMCMECEVEQFEELITFMASAQAPAHHD